VDTSPPRANINNALSHVEAVSRGIAKLAAPVDPDRQYDAHHALNSAMVRVSNAIRDLRAARDLLEFVETLPLT
jgi:hypothetical protein